MTTDEMIEKIRELNHIPSPLQTVMYVGADLFDIYLKEARTTDNPFGLPIILRKSNLYPRKLENGSIVQGVVFSGNTLIRTIITPCPD